MFRNYVHTYSSLLCIQYAIPIFDGLLPEPHNKTVIELLFTMAHWHRLAKLWMHNDLTLAVFDRITVSLGEKLRKFTLKTCPAFQTKELRREADARVRREAKKSAPKKGHGTSPNINTSMEPPTRLQQISAPAQDMDGPCSSNCVGLTSDAAADPSVTQQKLVNPVTR